MKNKWASRGVVLDTTCGTCGELRSREDFAHDHHSKCRMCEKRLSYKKDIRPSLALTIDDKELDRELEKELKEIWE